MIKLFLMFFHGQLNECVEKMIEFCHGMNFLIEVAAEDQIEAEKQSLAKGEDEQGISWIEPIDEDMLFELKWPTDVPPLEEDTVVPILEEEEEAGEEHVPQQESTAISLRIPGTAKNINVGCCTCNIS
jgi:hypothetical protein